MMIYKVLIYWRYIKIFSYYNPLSKQPSRKEWLFLFQKGVLDTKGIKILSFLPGPLEGEPLWQLSCLVYDRQEMKRVWRN